MKLILGTNNLGKLIEVRKMMQNLNITVTSPKEENIHFEVEETGTTFNENAKLKSEHLFSLTKLPSLADDSGLCVNALGGEPGLYSARFGKSEFSDKDRALYLLDLMKDKSDRSCYYHCSIAFTDKDGTFYFEDRCVGELCVDYDLEGKFGFGYDPIFYYPPLKERFSRVSTEKKNEISHRGLALKRFFEYFSKKYIK
ncbi:MAG: RdgB/HAM1 family non-canonical purine NTP pyrophosphatase [Leptospiraceae bacterium]|nr:RdgB/HAM1 family non-canonical purine NTP pyrophosphatase [Leptospiraceae bacterium]